MFCAMLINLLNMLSIIKLNGADENGKIRTVTNAPPWSTPL